MSEPMSISAQFGDGLSTADYLQPRERAGIALYAGQPETFQLPGPGRHFISHDI